MVFEQSPPFMGGELGQAAIDGHGPQKPMLGAQPPSTQANACRHSGSGSVP
jgi:hypothetical protein